MIEELEDTFKTISNADEPDYCCRKKNAIIKEDPNKRKIGNCNGDVSGVTPPPCRDGERLNIKTYGRSEIETVVQSRLRKQLFPP